MERATAWRWTTDALALALVVVTVNVLECDVPLERDRAALERCEIARDRARMELDDARIAIRDLEEASTRRDDADTPVHGALVLARITRADDVAWAEVGDACQLVIGFASALSDCTATLQCAGRRFPSPIVTCDAGDPATVDPWTAPALRYVWPRDPERPLAVRLDVRAARLTIRRVSHEPTIEAEVRSITTFELP